MTEPGVEDATRRTRLANERTYLAWWRTGLTALAVCVGVGRLVPSVSGGTRWPYVVLGVGYGIVGIALIAAGYSRARDVEHALDEGSYARVEDRLLRAFTAAGIVLGVATVAVLLIWR
jgi:inner membrane protein YidH